MIALFRSISVVCVLYNRSKVQHYYSTYFLPAKRDEVKGIHSYNLYKDMTRRKYTKVTLRDNWLSARYSIAWNIS